ncbi:MAG: histidine kinase [Aggregatilineales bacterium]
MNKEHNQPENALQESEEKYRTLFDLIDKGFCICEILLDDNGAPRDYRFLEVNALFEDHTGLKDATDKTALELVPELEYHWIETYGKVALTGEPLRFEQGSSAMGRWFDVYAFRFGNPELHKFAIVFNDITQRKLSEIRSELLQGLASSLSNALTWQELTQIIIDEGAIASGASGALIPVISKDKTHLNFLGTHGYPQSILDKWQNIPVDSSNVGVAWVIRENTPLWIRDKAERDSIVPRDENYTRDDLYASWALLPFNVDSDVIGAIVLAFSTPTDFDANERSFLLTITEYYAQALHRAKLTEQLTRHAASLERQRLSRDLHDSVKQLLFASSTIAQSLPRMWDQSSPRAREYTNDVVNLNRAALAELQTLLLEMRPEAIVSTPFMALVNNLCSGLRGHQAIEIEINYNGPDELFLPPDVHIAMYRLMQEILNNVNKHSNATELYISCAFDRNYFQLFVRDNGKGFLPNSSNNGFGLNTMQERADAIGATFDVISEMGSGTQITINWGDENASLSHNPP